MSSQGSLLSNQLLYLSELPFCGLLYLFDVATVPTAFHPAVRVALIVSDVRGGSHDPK